MKIEIDYNGAYAVCKVNGRFIHQCDSLTRAQAFSAFRTIEQHFRREERNKTKKSDVNCSLDENKNAKELLFAICRVLREFGYHKESARYFVKPDNEEPVILHLEERNTWKIKHHDFNGYTKYVKEMGEVHLNRWNELNHSLFSEFNKDGYICTIPLEEQVIAFAERMGFKITDIRNLSLTLKEIILAYRKINKFPTAFNKYIKRFCNDNKC